MNERRKKELPEPQLIRCYASEMYLLVICRSRRTPTSWFTLDIRQIDGNHIQNVLLAKEDIDNLTNLIKQSMEEEP